MSKVQSLSDRFRGRRFEVGSNFWFSIYLFLVELKPSFACNTRYSCLVDLSECEPQTSIGARTATIQTKMNIRHLCCRGIWIVFLLFCFACCKTDTALGPTAHKYPQGLLPPECLMLAKSPLGPPTYLSVFGGPHRLNDASIPHNQKLWLCKLTKAVVHSC